MFASCNNKCLIVGISGTTCAGKTTLAKQLQATHPNAIVITQDSYYLKDLSHTWIDELDHPNLEDERSMDMDQMLQDIVRHCTNDATTLIIVDGFTIFQHPSIESLCDIKIFLSVPRNICVERRSRRNYPECERYFSEYVWPAYESYRKFVEHYVDDVQFFDGECSNLDQRISELIAIKFIME